MTPTWNVTWEIDIEAVSAREAAKKALEIQRDPTSIALVFRVTQHVDLLDSKGQDLCPVCGETITLKDEMTKDERLIGSCGDAFTREAWECPNDGTSFLASRNTPPKR